MNTTSPAAAQHQPTLDFIGTDIEEAPARQARYVVACSCGEGDAVNSRSAESAARWTALHVAATL